MLVELDIRGLAVAEHVRVPFGPGLTVITGETGAGKSIIIDALGLLLGGRSDSGLVRAGASAAIIQGVFQFDHATLPEELTVALTEAEIALDEGVLVLSREQPAAGRSIGRINGRTAVISTLTSIGSRLVDIHGQSDHTTLLQPAQQLRLLDRFAGSEMLRTAMAEPLHRLRTVRAELARLKGNERERIRLRERLEFEAAEIQSAALRPDEEEELRAERILLENAVQLADLADSAGVALRGGGRVSGAVDALGRAVELVAQLAELDPRLSDAAATAAVLQEQATDLARELRDYRDAVEHNPARLSAVEERIAQINQLERKYGATLAEVLEYGAEAAQRLADLARGETSASELQAADRELVGEVGERAIQLSEARARAAQAFVTAVEREAHELRLQHARLGVAFSRRPDPEGVDVEQPAFALLTSAGVEESRPSASPYGVDVNGMERIEFMVSLNPGEPLRPLARVASGGETSRLLLALKSVLGDADSVPILVFDEIEAGLGGRTGGVVAEKLVQLAQRHQVICITHLAQIAAAGNHHLRVVKTVRDDRTHVEVELLDGDERVAEIAAMLGGSTAANLAGARELLGRVSNVPGRVKAR